MTGEIPHEDDSEFERIADSFLGDSSEPIDPSSLDATNAVEEAFLQGWISEYDRDSLLLAHTLPEEQRAEIMKGVFGNVEHFADDERNVGIPSGVAEYFREYLKNDTATGGSGDFIPMAFRQSNDGVKPGMTNDDWLALPQETRNNLRRALIEEPQGNGHSVWRNRAKGAGVSMLGFALGYGALEVIDNATDLDPVFIHKLTAGSIGSMVTCIAVVSVMTSRIKARE